MIQFVHVLISTRHKVFFFIFFWSNPILWLGHDNTIRAPCLVVWSGQINYSIVTCKPQLIVWIVVWSECPVWSLRETIIWIILWCTVIMQPQQSELTAILKTTARAPQKKSVFKLFQNGRTVVGLTFHRFLTRNLHYSPLQQVYKLSGHHNQLPIWPCYPPCTSIYTYKLSPQYCRSATDVNFSSRTIF